MNYCLLYYSSEMSNYTVTYFIIMYHVLLIAIFLVLNSFIPQVPLGTDR